jgi:tRNA 2-thiouridine synthesizing protein E
MELYTYLQGANMGEFNYQGKTYKVDEKGFLLDSREWDEKFAKGMATELKISKGLTKEQWEVLGYIRRAYDETGKCPIVYETCRMTGLRLKELKKLFPTGYLRGACKLAGITYKEGYLGQSCLPKTADDLNVISANKIYRMDVRGFLVDPDDWDEYYAVFRAYDMKIPGGRLTDQHWSIIHYIRDRFKKSGEIPTVYEVCEGNAIGLDELERLFPDGYHRGAVKIAGLRAR